MAPFFLSVSKAGKQLSEKEGTQFLLWFALSKAKSKVFIVNQTMQLVQVITQRIETAFLHTSNVQVIF